MKAITLWQPWASLLACGAKKFETRSWATSYRGPIAIHAAKRKPSSIWEAVEDIVDRVCLALGIIDLDDLPLGDIIATAELVDCHIIRSYIDETAEACFQRGTDDYELITGDEFLFGDWTPGRYAWEFKNMKILSEPIPAKGKQRIWEWSD